MAYLKLRDRDAIVTEENLIFRVIGYLHPSDAYVCDAEYAPSKIFKSENPKAPRSKGRQIFYKFYEDEGWRFITNNFAKYTIFHEMLQTKVLGIRHKNIVAVRKPEEELKRIVETDPQDELIVALQDVLKIIVEYSGLSREDFGVFGSILHNFHHPKLSDLDFTVYGRQNMHKLGEALQELYKNESSVLKNEFETDEVVRGKHWKFQNYSSQEYIWHQRRKLIYAHFDNVRSGRVIKTEFEPVKDWKEIESEYNTDTEIVQRGWTKILARIIEDEEAPFIPSIYGIEPLKIMNGPKTAVEAKRIVSYMEEFRMQVQNGETVIVEGNLEEVKTPKGDYFQVTLTYCPRYYEQVLKVAS
ncbi:MAG: hypothetical protein PVH12_01445 [Candidatus Bathyarchaeota archaeon]